MKRFMILITAIAAAYLSMPVAAVAQWEDTLWTRGFSIEYVTASRFTPDNKYVLASVGKTLCKYDALTGDLVSRFKDTCEEKITVMEISKKLSIIATLDFPQDTLFIWDYNQERIIKKIPVKYNTSNGASHMALTSDDKYLILGLLRSDVDNIIIYETETWTEKKILNLQGGKKNIAISPDDKFFVVGSLDYNESEKRFYSHLTLWKSETWEFVKELGFLKDEIINLKYSPDGRYLACCRRSSEPMTVWDMQTVSKIKDYYPKDSLSFYYINVSFSNDSKYIFMTPNGFIEKTIIWDMINDTLIHQYPFHSIYGLEISKDNKYLLTSSGSYIRVLAPKWGPTGIDNISSKLEEYLFSSYKNNFLYLDFKMTSYNAIRLSVYDSSGKVNFTKELGNFDAGLHNIQIPLSLPSGVYFATLKYGNRTISKQFEVVR